MRCFRPSIVLLVISAFGCAGSGSMPSAPPTTATSTYTGNNPFVSMLLGTWHNVDPNTQSVTHATFGVQGDALRVEMWGRCQPADCDWGVTSLPLSAVGDSSFSVIWNGLGGGAAKLTQTEQITLLPDGQLQALGVASSEQGLNVTTKDFLTR